MTWFFSRRPCAAGITEDWGSVELQNNKWVVSSHCHIYWNSIKTMSNKKKVLEIVKQVFTCQLFVEDFLTKVFHVWQEFSQRPRECLCCFWYHKFSKSRVRLMVCFITIHALPTQASQRLSHDLPLANSSAKVALPTYDCLNFIAMYKIPIVMNMLHLMTYRIWV